MTNFDKIEEILVRLVVIILSISLVFFLLDVCILIGPEKIKSEDGFYGDRVIGTEKENLQKTRNISIQHSGKTISSTLSKYNLKMLEKKEIPRIVYFSSKKETNVAGFYDSNVETYNLLFINYDYFNEILNGKYLPSYYSSKYFFEEQKNDKNVHNKMLKEAMFDNIKLDSVILHEYAHFLQHRQNLYYQEGAYYMSENRFESENLSYNFNNVLNLKNLNQEQEAELFSKIIIYRYLCGDNKELMKAKVPKRYYDYILSRFGDYVNH